MEKLGQEKTRAPGEALPTFKFKANVVAPLVQYDPDDSFHIGEGSTLLKLGALVPTPRHSWAILCCGVR